MDRLRNPFTPGAGVPPPVFAGRQAEIDHVRFLMRRFEAGFFERGMLMTGLRGVGKTVLLTEIESVAKSKGFGWGAVFYEVPSKEAVPFRDAITAKCSKALLQLDRGRKFSDVRRGIVRGVRSARPKIGADQTGQWSLGFDVDPQTGATLSEPERDLGDVFEELGEVAKSKGKGVLIIVDEVQHLSAGDLSALIIALHRVAKKKLPIALVAAGLPTLPRLSKEVQTYAGRMFHPKYRHLGQISDEAARAAFTEADKSVAWEPVAIERLLEVTDRYPHFIQEWGKQVWDIAPTSPVRFEDVEAAHEIVMDTLDESQFHDRALDATPREYEIMKAMALLGDGPYRTSEAATAAGFSQEKHMSAFRQALIKKGLLYVPSRGQLAFTVPHFADYLRDHKRALDSSASV